MGKKVKVSCLNCGTANNFPLDAVGKKVVCGKCRSPLPEPGRVLEPLPGQIYTLYQKSSLPVLVDFYSQSCVHCRSMEPILMRLAKKRAGSVVVIKANLDTHAELGASLGVRGVPTFFMIHKGVEKGRRAGAMAETDFSSWVSTLVS